MKEKTYKQTLVYSKSGRRAFWRVVWPLISPIEASRGSQTFPKSTEIRNSEFFRAVFSVFFHPNLYVVAESVSELLLQHTGGLGGQFWLSKESVSTSATDCRIPTPICTKYRLQEVRTNKFDGLYFIRQISRLYVHIG